MNETDRRIKKLCEEKGLKFRPWEFPRPWEISDSKEIHPTLAHDKWYPKVIALRAKLKAELGR